MPQCTEIQVEKTMGSGSPLDNSTKDRLSALPLELKDHVLDSLYGKDILMMRLASKCWSTSGAEHMFKEGFTVRPHLKDMARLENVSRNPFMARGLKNLTFFVGDCHYEYLMQSVKRYIANKKRPRRQLHVHSRTRVHDSHERQHHADQEFLRKTRKLLSGMFSADSLKTHCNTRLLQQVLPRLPNLTEISLTSTKHPFSGWGGLETAWGHVTGFHEEIVKPECYGHMNYRGAPFQHFILSTARYYDIVTAAESSISPLQKINMDAFPIDCLWVAKGPELHKNFIDKFHRVSTEARDLRIGFTHRAPRTSVVMARTVGSLLSPLKYLTHLDISWYMLQGCSATVSKEYLETIHRSFFKSRWTVLQSLRLRFLRAYESNLLPFLREHSATLKYLHLSDWALVINHENCPPDECTSMSYREILTNIRDSLTLEKFELLIDEERDKPIYDAEWNEFEDKFQPNSLKNAILLEWYVQDMIEWPMQRDNPYDNAEYSSASGWTPISFWKLIPLITTDNTNERWRLTRRLENAVSRASDDDDVESHSDLVSVDSDLAFGFNFASDAHQTGVWTTEEGHPAVADGWITEDSDEDLSDDYESEEDSDDDSDDESDNEALNEALAESFDVDLYYSLTSLN